MKALFLVVFIAGAVVAPTLAYRILGRGRHPMVGAAALAFYLGGAWLGRFVFRGPFGVVAGGILAVVIFGLAAHRRLGILQQTTVAKVAGTVCHECEQMIVVNASGTRCNFCTRGFHKKCLGKHVCKSV